ncbi:MAG: RsmE family RNA methyltransferase [Candidatus Omnitrophota bacterium]
MNKFFCKDSDMQEDKINISNKEDVHHIKNVLRLKQGGKVEVSDESGNVYACEIFRIDDNVHLVVKNKICSTGIDRGIELTVAVAIPKKAKIDDIIDKLVQLGVRRVIPLKTERVIVKLDKQKEADRFLRWKKIALCAAKQCKRSDLAVIEPVRSFKDVVADSSRFDLKLIPYLGGERRTLRDVLAKGDVSTFLEPGARKVETTPFALKSRNVPLFSKVMVLIGPEGDFSEEEVQLALSAGFIPVTLGSLVLRVDTAAIAVAGFIRLFLGQERF